jgi:hypothetical protein
VKKIQSTNDDMALEEEIAFDLFVFLRFIDRHIAATNGRKKTCF